MPAVVLQDFDLPQREAAFFYGLFLRGHSAEQLRRDQERKDLQLSRVRIMNDLNSATHPQHRKSLEAALAHLDKKISEVG